MLTNPLLRRVLGVNRAFSTTTMFRASKSFKLVVVGGGAGGCSTAAKFASKLGKGQVAVIEPQKTHYYQAMWTLVGGGVKDFKKTGKPMSQVLPQNAEWIQEKVTGFQPENCQVTVESGDTICYEYLVVAMGLQLNFGDIPGLLEALEDPAGSGVCSNYDEKYVLSTYPATLAFKQGNAVFTFPNTPIKCAGAPQKIAYLTDYNLRQMGKRDKAKIMYHTTLPVLFGVKKYADALWKVVEEKSIDVTLRSNLVAVNGAKKEAVFENLDKPEQPNTVIPYEMLHVAPPMGTPDALNICTSLVDEAGFLNVNKETLQHLNYPNIFGIGDCTNVPVAKTAAAVASESGILRRNLEAVLAGKDSLSAKYNGYTSCPLIISPKKCILAEFDFSVPPKPMETFPFDQAKPRRSMYLLKAEVMPRVYWKMLEGYWEGPGSIRKLTHLGYLG